MPSKKNHYVAVRHFYGLVDFCECSNLVEVSGSGILYTRVQLRDNTEILVFLHQGTNQSQRALSSDGQGKDRSREQDSIPNRKDRQSLWHYITFVCHGFLSPADRKQNLGPWSFRCVRFGNGTQLSSD